MEMKTLEEAIIESSENISFLEARINMLQHSHLMGWAMSYQAVLLLAKESLQGFISLKKSHDRDKTVEFHEK